MAELQRKKMPDGAQDTQPVAPAVSSTRGHLLTGAQPEMPPGSVPEAVRETGGPTGLEPTRFGDWERGGRCIDF